MNTDRALTANATPATAATLVSVRLSASIWRRRTPRPAPRATRIAHSESLALARARNRFATFTQPINMTRSAPPCSSHSRLLTEATLPLRRGADAIR